jgi:multiple sugar transport system substrate-binding protein
VKGARDRLVRVALVGGPMYDPLYESIAAFEREAGLSVEVVVRLPHPELNAWVKAAFSAGDPDIDLLSTHTKYAPSQAPWLSPLDDLVPAAHVNDLLERPLELSRIDGRLLQVPRNIDVRLLHYRRDLLDPAAPADPEAMVRDRVPATWSELADRATALTTASRSGFLFPGRDSGLFGTFYELLVGAGGTLFDDSLRPAFNSSAGVWAVSFIVDLHQTRRVTPRALPGWHYDEISLEFREGRAAMMTDWPGSFHLYRDPKTCRVADRVGVAMLPAGPSGVRAAYGGCHSFAIPRTARNPSAGTALLRHLTSFDAQLGEARLGAIPCRASALARVREDAAGHPVDAYRWQLLADTEATMIVPPRFAAYPDCEDAIWRAVQKAMIGEWSADEAIKKAAEEIWRIVNSGRAGLPSR